MSKGRYDETFAGEDGTSTVSEFATGVWGQECLIISYHSWFKVMDLIIPVS